jgi:murein DD-endopeptidase MepM/ murein hydrolase activator NlpD
MPGRPRFDVGTYVVEQGDTLFAIANRFGLKPETILWGNFDILEDDPHSLQPGQSLSILPVDGTFYVWHEGDLLNGVAEFFGVEAQEIIEWPGNRLKPDMDPEQPDIEAGTRLVIPGGTRETVDWRSPRITRANPASARILGPGYCGSVVDGPIGAGFFSWPTPSTIISGYVFNPVIHPAIDIGGTTGNAIFAVDAGVVVYAGWHNGGYGYVVVIDHGNGWQSLYAHMSSVGAVCGQDVYQGDVIAGMGCTGNCSGTHLHFELMHDQFGKVNPLNYLP